MAQTKMGATKRAAHDLGLSLDEYLSMIEAGLKRCRTCKTWKPTEEFGADRNRGDGLATICRNCRYPQHGTSPGKRERIQRREEEGLGWCHACNAWLPVSAVHRGLCRVHEREAARERYRTDLAYRMERREHAHSRKRNIAPIPVTGQEYIFEEFGGLCAYCGSPATTWDHVLPVKRGGETLPWNIVPACSSCNSSKNASDVMDWLQSKGIERLPYQILDRLCLEFA